MLEYTSKNGYTGQLYGGGALRIVDPYGKEVFHTAYSTIMNEEELKKEIDGFPEFVERIMKNFAPKCT